MKTSDTGRGHCLGRCQAELSLAADWRHAVGLTRGERPCRAVQALSLPHREPFCTQHSLRLRSAALLLCVHCLFFLVHFAAAAEAAPALFGISTALLQGWHAACPSRPHCLQTLSLRNNNTFITLPGAVCLATARPRLHAPACPAAPPQRP